MTLQEVLSRFEVDRRINSASYQCKCPNKAMHKHGDKNASLTISEKNGKILFHCKVNGCETEDILAAVGLTFADINGEKEKPVYTWKDRLEYSQKKKIEALYHYKDENGKYLYTKVRFEGKVMRYVTIDEVNDKYQYGKAEGRKTLYNLPELIRGVREGYPVYYVEGEKDVNTLREMGLIATTAGSSNDWEKEFARFFTGAKIVILADNDGPGMALKDDVVKDLKHYAHSIKWCITSRTEKGDVTDYIKKEGHTKEDLQRLVSEAELLYAPWIYSRGNDLKINSGILADSISRGLDYLIVGQPFDDRDDFYLYEQGVYNKCNRNKVKSIIMRYIPKEMVSDNLINNTYNLLMCQGRRICSFRELDSNEQYINVQNGLYNIKTKKLEPHTPKVYSTTQLRCIYNPKDSSRHMFEKYINDLCTDTNGNIDKEKMAIIQEFIGLLLSNVKVYRSKAALVLYSLLGNTGKTQMLKLLNAMLGEGKTANIPIQNMNEASKFSLGSIVGKRIISIGDQTSSEIKDSAIFKQLTGGDDVKVEQKGKQPFDYCFPGGIIIACNNLPSFSDDKGGHLFDRLQIIPLTNVIEECCRDPKLLDKMLKEKSAILNWFLEGLHRLIDNDYKFTKSVSCCQAKNEYRSKLDTVYRYLSEHCVVTGNREDMISKPKLEDDYISWCNANGYTHVNKQNIRERMEANGCIADKARYEGKVGVMVYRGVLFQDTKFESLENEVCEQIDIPFE